MIEFEHNEAHEDHSVDLGVVWDAAVAVLRERGYRLPSNPRRGESLRYLDTGDVGVVVERLSGGITRVRVRIGTFETDDQKRKARLLLDGIRDRIR